MPPQVGRGTVSSKGFGRFDRPNCCNFGPQLNRVYWTIKSEKTLKVAGHQRTGVGDPCASLEGLPQGSIPTRSTTVYEYSLSYETLFSQADISHQRPFMLQSKIWGCLGFDSCPRDLCYMSLIISFVCLL